MFPQIDQARPLPIFVQPPHRGSPLTQSASYKGALLPCLTEIAETHPEAPLEIWSQDEARVGQKGRTGYVWWQRGHTLNRAGFPGGRFV
jgi:hypothetical protein